LDVQDFGADRLNYGAFQRVIAKEQSIVVLFISLGDDMDASEIECLSEQFSSDSNSPSSVTEGEYFESSSDYNKTSWRQNRCPYPECREIFKDLKAHMLTHQNARSGKYPSQSYKDEKNHGSSSLCNGKMPCTFSTDSGFESTVPPESVNGADSFRGHFRSADNFEQASALEDVPISSHFVTYRTHSTILKSSHGFQGENGDFILRSSTREGITKETGTWRANSKICFPPTFAPWILNISFDYDSLQDLTPYGSFMNFRSGVDFIDSTNQARSSKWNPYLPTWVPGWDDALCIIQLVSKGEIPETYNLVHHVRERNISTSRHLIQSGIRMDGTCQWIFDNEQYLRWRGGAGGTLWVSGSPGTGKSVLTSTVIDELKASLRLGELMVAYCADADFRGISPVNSILWEISVKILLREPQGRIRDEIRSNLQDLAHLGSRVSVSRMKIIMSTIRHSLRSNETLYLFLDGLDEVESSPSEENLVQEFIDQASGKHQDHRIKCFVSVSSSQEQKLVHTDEFILSVNDAELFHHAFASRGLA
jgi:hypothetical protein